MPADRLPSCARPMRFLRCRVAAVLGCLALLPTVPCTAQSYIATVLPQPNLRLTLPGDVRAMVRQSDGKLIVGGSFDLSDNSLRRNLARFNADGTLDTGWVVDTDAQVNALAIDGNDTLYVGGSFTRLGGVARNALGKVAANGVVDATWNPVPNNLVSVLRVSGGAIYVGGAFSSIGGTPRVGVARVSMSGAGALDMSWNPAPNNSVSALLESGASLYLGGSFSQVGGTPRARLAKVSTLGSGALDGSWNPGADFSVNALASDSTGAIVVGGLFFNVGGLARNCIARLDPANTGAADPAWIAAGANSGCTVRTLAADGNGAVLVGGAFSTIGGVGRNNAARLLDTGVVDPVWNADVQAQLYQTTARVDAVLPLPAGASQIGGVFDTVGPGHNFGTAKLGATGSRDVSFLAALDSLGEVRALADDPVSGLTYVGGSFGLADGQVRRNLLRLAPDLTLDPGWAGSVNGAVHALRVDGAQRVYAGGVFTRSEAVVRNYVARFDVAGVLDATWNPNANFNVEALELSSDGSNLHLGGAFTQIGGQPRNRLARVSTSGSGTPPDAWNPNANGNVQTLALRPSDGVVYAGGAFTQLGGMARGYAGKIGSDGSVDASWNPNFNNFVEALAIDPRPTSAKLGSSGSIGVGGEFTLDPGVAGLDGYNGLVFVQPEGAGLFDPIQDPSLPTGSRVLGLGDYPTSIFPAPLHWITGSIPGVGGLDDIGLRIVDGTTVAAEALDVYLHSHEVLFGTKAHFYFNRRGSSGPSGSPQPSILLGGRMTGVDGQQRIGLAAITLTTVGLFKDGFE